MSNDFNLRFVNNNLSYDINFIEKKEPSKNTVLINDRNYEMQGDPFKIEWLKTKIPDLKNSSEISLQELQVKLQNLGAKDITPSKTHLVGVKHLSSVQAFSEISKVDAIKKELIELIPHSAGAMVAFSAQGKEPQIVCLGKTSVDLPILKASLQQKKEKLQNKNLNEEQQNQILKEISSLEVEIAKGEQSKEVDSDTAALIGSGAKMFTALVSKVLEEKGILSLKDTLAQHMRKEHLAIFENREAAGNITLEMLLSHTSGLQYGADDWHNDREKQSLDQILDGIVKQIEADPSKENPVLVRFTSVPGDKVYSYSNQIGLAAVFIEKSYKKKLALELIENKKLSESHEFKFKDSTVTVKEVIQAIHEKKAYLTIGGKEEYVYDLLDAFLISQGTNPADYDYAAILKRELLDPLEMNHTSFQKPQEGKVLRVYSTKVDELPTSRDVEILDPKMRPAGGLWSTLDDMVKLAKAFKKEGVRTRQDGSNQPKQLISSKGMQDLVTCRGINGKSGLGLDVIGSLVGKGGGIETYDFKFKIDLDTQTYLISMSNFADTKPAFDNYITRVVNFIDELDDKASTNEAKVATTSPDVAPLGDQAHFFMGQTGYVGVEKNSLGERISVNWNGQLLPLQKIKENVYKVTSGLYAGHEVVFRDGKASGSDYLFIQHVSDVKVMESYGFKEINQVQQKEIQDIKSNKNISLEKFLGAGGNYISPLGAPPMALSVDSNKGFTLKVDKGAAIGGIVTNVRHDEHGEPAEIWFMGNFSEPPDKIFKIAKGDFVRKETADKLAQEKEKLKSLPPGKDFEQCEKGILALEKKLEDQQGVDWFLKVSDFISKKDYETRPRS